MCVCKGNSPTYEFGFVAGDHKILTFVRAALSQDIPPEKKNRKAQFERSTYKDLYNMWPYAMPYLLI